MNHRNNSWLRGWSLWLVVLASATASCWALAQDCCKRCGAPGRECGCDSRICESPPPRSPVNPSPPQQSPGAFIAPPQNGTVYGAAESVGVRGMEIELPALRLKMPSVKFPSVFRSRDNAHMVLDSASAPYVANGYAPVTAGILSAPLAPNAPTAPQNMPGTPQNTPVTPPAAPVSECTDHASQLSQLLYQLAQQKQQVEAARSVEQSAGQRIQELENAERNLDRKISQLQGCLDQLLSLQINNSQTGEATTFATTADAPLHLETRPGGTRRLPAANTATSASYTEPNRFIAPQHQLRRLPRIDDN